MRLQLGEAAAVLIIAGISSNASVAAENYILGCDVPQLPGDAQSRHIDDVCPNAGESEVASPKGLQNVAKNNLCGKGDPIVLALADFMSLQDQAIKLGIPFGADGFGSDRVEHLPPDRSVLTSGNFSVNDQSIGEGDKVQVVAFIDDPHPADVGKGESVNCHNPDAVDNDIHINLVPEPAPSKALKSDTDEVKKEKKAARNAALCKAIVAEMIPHYRPDEFDAKYLISIAKRKIPVRISGQLFFDASHRPCDGLTPKDSSVRGSLWEIHPVYSMDVCKETTLDQCMVGAENSWIPFLDWIGSGIASSVEFDTNLKELEEERLQDNSDREGEHEGE